MSASGTKQTLPGYGGTSVSKGTADKTPTGCHVDLWPRADMAERPEPFYDPKWGGGEIPLAREQRRLAAIMSADVAGYSRLIGRGEKRMKKAVVLAGHRCKPHPSAVSGKLQDRRHRIAPAGPAATLSSVAITQNCGLDFPRQAHGNS